jgi:hypothetical protein
MGGRNVLTVVAAMAVLVAVLVLAGVLHGDVELVYDESGNGCRTLAPASDRELEQAMWPVRLLVSAWVLVTGAWLVRSARRAGTPPARIAGSIPVLLVLAGAQMLFIATDVLLAVVPLLATWLSGLAMFGLLGVGARARRGEPAGYRSALLAAWVVVVVGVLPVALLVLTGDGAIRSC